VFFVAELESQPTPHPTMRKNSGLTTSIKTYFGKNIPALGVDSLLGSRQQAIARNMVFDQSCYFSLLAFVLFLAYFKD
jgi:hypothetical protein